MKRTIVLSGNTSKTELNIQDLPKRYKGSKDLCTDSGIFEADGWTLFEFETVTSWDDYGPSVYTWVNTTTRKGTVDKNFLFETAEDAIRHAIGEGHTVEFVTNGDE